MRSTQIAPGILVGLLADLPNPSEIPLGYIFYATDSTQFFVLAIDSVTQLRTWNSVASAIIAGLIHANGSVPFTANQTFAGFRATNLGAPQAADDNARAGDVTWSPVDTHTPSFGVGDFTVGNSFQTQKIPLVITGARAKVPGAGTYRCKLWRWDGTLLATAPDVVTGGATTILPNFGSVALATNERYIVSIWPSGVGFIASALIAGKLPLAGALASAPSGPLLTPCGGIGYVYPQFFFAGDAAPVTADTGNLTLVPIEPVFA